MYTQLEMIQTLLKEDMCMYNDVADPKLDRERQMMFLKRLQGKANDLQDLRPSPQSAGVQPCGDSPCRRACESQLLSQSQS